MITKPNAVSKKQWRFARHLQKVRIAHSITQEQLAAKIGTSTQWIGNIESGREVPNLAMLGKIARALGVKVKDLIPF